MSGHSPEIPPISDEDIAWACSALGLPPNAFAGPDGNDPRMAALKSLGSLDLAACPGSGKTTLLIAKLAILARGWTERRCGVCVLSHTNVARLEIETRLGRTAEGRRLLSYPHFVGTIHGFVNEFLALPWLRSKSYPVKVVDDEACLRRRWNKLPPKVRAGLEMNRHDQNVLRLAATDFSVGEVRWGKKNILGVNTDTYQSLKAACRKSCEEGYFCHAEMFLWAAELLEQVPATARDLRGRFPMLFIDEVQDTSEEQSSLLYKLFIQGNNPVVRQRFGDSNQAIYQYSGQSGDVATDPFPDESLRVSVPNSHRFGQQIANLANPLAVSPHGLVGLGPHGKIIGVDTSSKHAVFLFDDKTVKTVIPCYASYLLELFSDAELQSGTFTAVGAVHRPGEDNKVPRYVGHYWSAYDHEVAGAEPRPGTFLQYLSKGRHLTESSGEAHHVVEKIAEGILQLAVLINPRADIKTRKRRHLQVRELLASHPATEELYLDIVSGLAVAGFDAVDAHWAQMWASQVRNVATIIAGTEEHSDDVNKFLSARVSEGGEQTITSVQRDNVFRFPAENPRVQIRVGSIHSVKGETHTATLVLDTFYHVHHLGTLLPWLTGAKSGTDKKTSRKVLIVSSLKQHYVAMTRPSHLLCLAMREDCLPSSGVAALKAHGWRVGRASDAGPGWL